MSPNILICLVNLSVTNSFNSQLHAHDILILSTGSLDSADVKCFTQELILNMGLLPDNN